MLGTHLAHCNARPERYRLAWEMPAQIDVPVGSVPEGWGHARLIPTFGIRNQQEQEKRATSCLLAVMHGVPEFGHALLKELDAPKAPAIETFAEVRFKDANGKTVIPDGAIVCRRGKKIWTCLVEVKTGSAQLKDEQVSAYLDIAKANQFDGVLTISGTPRDLGVNRAPGEGGPSPQRPAVVASAWHRGPGQPASDPIAAWVRAPPVCAPEQRVSQSSSRADVSPCLWWSGVAARGRRPPAMDGRRNGHGRRRSSCGRPSTSDESPRTRLIAGHSRLWTARVTPKRRGEPN